MIIKNEDSTFSIITETTEIVNLQDLEEQLANMEDLADKANRFNTWVDAQPVDMQTFLQKQYFIVPQELRDRVELLRGL